jgi:hypothetical protein
MESIMNKNSDFVKLNLNLLTKLYLFYMIHL